MPSIDNDPREETLELLRWGDVVVDPATGEIIEGSSPWDYERLMIAYQDSGQQSKYWEQRKIIFGALLRKTLEDGNTKKYTGDLGTVSLVSGTKRQAKADRLPGLAEALGITDADRLLILECAGELSVGSLDKLEKDRPDLAPAIAGLITKNGNPYVRFTPRLKTAPADVEKFRGERT